TPELVRDSAQCDRTFAELLPRNRQLANLVLVSTDGAVLCSALPPGPGVRFDDRKWFADVLASGDFVIGEHVTDRIAQRPVVVVAYPRMVDGRPAHVLAGSIDLSSLATLSAAAPMPDGSVLTLIDSAGTVLARHPDSEAWVGRNVGDQPLAQAALREVDGSARVHDVDGVERFYAFQPMPGPAGADAHLAVGIPVTQALARANRTLWRGLLALLIALLFALLLSRFT